MHLRNKYEHFEIKNVEVKTSYGLDHKKTENVRSLIGFTFFQLH